jgi:chromosome segregation ATPase
MVTVSKIDEAKQNHLNLQEQAARIRREGLEAQRALQALAPLPEGVSGDEFAARQAEEHNWKAKLARLKGELAAAEQAVREADARLQSLQDRAQILPRVIADMRWNCKNVHERHIAEAERDLRGAQARLETARQGLSDEQAKIRERMAELAELIGEVPGD